MAQSKKDLIITKGTEIIAESGMEGFSLSLLASAVGITKATLYSYYKSKDDIFSDIITTGHKNFMKMGFSISLKGKTEEVLMNAADHWMKIFLSSDNKAWLRVIFSNHLINELCREEYKLIVLMLKSQAGVVISSFGLKELYTSTLTSLFSSFLLATLESALSDDEVYIEEECRRVSVLIEDLRKKGC